MNNQFRCDILSIAAIAKDLFDWEVFHLFKHYMDTFLYAVIGGICIGLGGTAYLCTDNSILGAVLFTVGLFTICTMNFNLYTGKVAYLFDNKPSYLIDVLFIWLGNLAGTYIIALLLSFTRIGAHMQERAAAICEMKLSDGLVSLFILGIFCNMLIFIAVDVFKNNPHPIGKYLALFLGVIAFIVCGFEHSVADMFYFSTANAWSLKAFTALIVITLGNAVGGLLIPIFRIAHNKLTAADSSSK